VREEAEVDPLIAIAERRAAARSGGPAFDVSGEDAGQRRIADGHDDHRYGASRERAYQIWLEEHCPEGRDKVHWETATAQIASEGGPPSTR
jgi:hypothetical protein